MTAPCPSVHIHAACHCQQFSYNFSLPLTSFPLKSAVCSCNSCRHATGQLFATFAVVPLPLPTEAQGFDKLVRYDSSSSISRYSCSNCGASVLNVETGEWEFATGVLTYSMDGGGDAFDLVEGGLLDRCLLFIGDSLDGGAASWINAGKGEGLAGRKMGHRDSQDVVDAMLIGMNQYSKQTPPSGVTKLEGKCHCGNVQLEILQPDEQAGKYGAGLCACTSCRISCGFEITSWIKLPLHKVRMADGRSFEEGAEDMGFYSTSPNVSRHFCKRCGATISYAQKGAETVDLAPGLFNAAEGSRSEHWLHWNQDGDALGYTEDAVDQKFAQRLAEGVRSQTSTR